jgi:PAS domain S-box-containing protein
MRAAIEHAGAERGLLIARRGDELQIQAQATASGADVTVNLRDSDHTEAALPQSLVRYVMRTRETVILEDAASQNLFSADPYLVRHRARSILCLPLINRGNLIGVLYLENNLAPRVFASARIAVLKLLASQAAISLENTRLYRELANREAKIRRLVDANIFGIFIWDLHGTILDANDAFLRVLGYEREDLVAGRLRWTDLTAAQWGGRDRQELLAEVQRTGSLQPFEWEHVRKDGSRVPVLVGAASFEGENQGVAFVLDLTERKRAEQSLRQLESDLAHVNRLSMMGVLTASLAHEVKQPIATARNNARAALNFLARSPPDLGEVREALGCIVGDADRAGDIIDRIRAHIKKAPPRKDRFDLNEAVTEVVELARSAITRHGVSLQMRLAEGLFTVEADRVQLQQVILNLILNAIEAMSLVDGPRELLISTEQRQTNGLVSVSDSGPGIDPEKLERVFEAFYTTKSDGVGIGLSICRSIIDAHGGRLWMEANEPRGATFQFTVPSAAN